MSTREGNTTGLANLTSLIINRGNPQPKNTSMPTRLGTEFHLLTNDGMIPFAKGNNNLPMHTRDKTTILELTNARSSTSKIAQKIYPMLGSFE
jgi:hypothetical protein